MGIWSWAKTAAGNRLVGSINWQEGQAPSTINDSAVAEMADVAKWRDDIGGALDSTGSAGVYALATNGTVASLGAGLSLTFKANHASPGASTLNVDALGAKKILVIDDDGERELDADEIDAGGFYQVFYDPDADSSAGAWILTGVSSSVAADSLKLGGVLASAYALAADVTAALANKLNAASYTAADVLAKLLTVHGHGSGLDADTLDGKHANEIGSAPNAFLVDQKSSGTNGGGSTANTWVTRTLNTEIFDPDGLLALSSNQFTPSVDGVVEGACPAYEVRQHKAQIYCITDSVAVATGTSERCEPGNLTKSVVVAPVEAGKAYELRHFCNYAATDGLGVGYATAGVAEVFSTLKFWRS